MKFRKIQSAPKLVDRFDGRANQLKITCSIIARARNTNPLPPSPRCNVEKPLAPRDRRGLALGLQHWFGGKGGIQGGLEGFDQKSLMSAKSDIVLSQSANSFGADCIFGVMQNIAL